MELDIPHVCQKLDWDCGVACVEMILKYTLGENFNETTIKSVFSILNMKKSVWTIDLVNMLVNCNIDCVYHTITLGVDPGYKNQEFYQQCFSEDEMRVNKLFENAEQLGFNIVKRSVSIEEICLKINQGYVAIVLVDSNKLQCNYCENWELASCDYYCGHYILLCGYDNEQKLIIYKNPSKQIPQCFVNISDFESAWHSYGTDHDIIFINLALWNRQQTN